MIENRNGKRMPATLRYPNGDAVGTALVLHGLAGWKDQACVAVIANALTELGYTTLVFDAADGAKAPDANFAHATTSGYVEDIEDAVTFLKSQPWYRAPFVLAGHSQGALAALRYTRTHSDVVTRLLMVAPAVSWKTDAHIGMLTRLRLKKTDTNFKQNPTVTLYPKWIFDYFSFNGMKDASFVSVPTLIVSAQNDEFVADARVHEKLSKKFPFATHRILLGARHEFIGFEVVLADTIKEWLTSS